MLTLEVSAVGSPALVVDGDQSDRRQGDGGGKVPALARSLHGRNRVARTLVNWVRAAGPAPGGSLRRVEVNGAPGGLYLDARQRLVAVLALEIADGEIRGISSIVNPDKLRHLGLVGDLRSLLRPARGGATSG